VRYPVAQDEHTPYVASDVAERPQRLVATRMPLVQQLGCRRSATIARTLSHGGKRSLSPDIRPRGKHLMDPG